MTREEAKELLSRAKPILATEELQTAIDMAIDALQADVTQTDLVQRSDVLEVISDAQDGNGSTYNILQPIFVKVNNLPSCHRCDECDEQFYQQLLEKGMIELPQEYVSVVCCKDCRHADECHKSVQYTRNEPNTVTIGYTKIDFCSHGERREEVNGFKSVGQAWNTSQERGEK